jgi:electron transport complex protein RnfE
MSTPLPSSGSGHFTASSWWLLALCPSLAASDTVVDAVGLSAVALIVATLSSVLVVAIHRWLIESIRIPVAAVTLAGLVSLCELLMSAWFPLLQRSLAVYLPLLATNVALITAVSSWDAQRWTRTVIQGVRTGLLIAAALLSLGVARELVGRGSLFHDARQILGNAAGGLEFDAFPVDMGFLLAMLPPGAFIALGLLIAARNWVAAKIES